MTRTQRHRTPVAVARGPRPRGAVQERLRLTSAIDAVWLDRPLTLGPTVRLVAYDRASGPSSFAAAALADGRTSAHGDPVVAA